MGRKKTHDHTTGETLLDAAECILERAGANAISARAVAKAVNMPTRAIYSVFGDMDGLIAGLTARGYRVLGNNIRAIQPSDCPESDLVRVAMEGFRQFALKKPHLYRITFESIPAQALQNPDVQEATRESYDQLMQFIVRAQESGLGSNIARADFVIAFHACCQGLASVELSHQPPPVGANFWQPLARRTPETIWSLTIRGLLRGLDKS